MFSGLLSSLSVVLVTTLLVMTPAGASSIKSYAFVNNDGTLKIRSYRIHLYGIHIPQTSRTCNNRFQPAHCGSWAFRALEFKIGKGWPDCELKSRNADRSYNAICHVEGTDLSAYLLERGWAVALPDAPIEYQVLEKIARSRGFGVWGLALGE